MASFLHKSGHKLLCMIIFNLLQVATALLVAGSTLTIWIRPFASTSSYSSVVKAAARVIVGG